MRAPMPSVDFLHIIFNVLHSESHLMIQMGMAGALCSRGRIWGVYSLEKEHSGETTYRRFVSGCFNTIATAAHSFLVIFHGGDCRLGGGRI